MPRDFQKVLLADRSGVFCFPAGFYRSSNSSSSAAFIEPALSPDLVPIPCAPDPVRAHGEKKAAARVRMFPALVCAAVFLSFLFLPDACAQMKTGKKVPDFATSTLDGKPFVLKEYLNQPGNKVLILTFFATWCEHCDEDLDHLKELESRYGQQGVRVFCVFTGQLSKARAARKYLERKEIRWPILLDRKKAVSRRLKVTALPCTYAIDKQGVLAFQCVGCSDEARRKFEENLKALLSAS